MSEFDLDTQNELLTFGSELIFQTRALILDLWKKPSIFSELKEDNTPVSEIDIRCEELARKLIRERFSEHGVIGEEFGAERQESDFVWTIDPIDGTQNLINRIPTFGTILGLLYRGTPILGWIDHPALGEFLYGGSELGTFRNGEKVVIEDLKSYELTVNDIVATNCPATFDRGGHLETLWQILKFHPHTRMYYDVYAHSLAIVGSLAVMVEYNLKIWDLSATQALITGAGGEYREISRSEPSGKYPALYNAAFGKPRAVELISAILK